MPKAKLTNPKIEKLRPNPNKIVSWRDSEWSCLGLDISPGGQKTWKYVGEFKGRTVRRKIGRWPELDREAAYRGWVDADGVFRPGALDAARYASGPEAKDPGLLLKGDIGKALTLSKALEGYLQARKNLRPKTKKDYEKIVDRYFEDWKKRPLSEITDAMVEQRHSKIQKDVAGRKQNELTNGKSTANGAMRLFRALYNFAQGRDGSIAGRENPVKRLSRDRAWFKETKRRGRVSKEDLPEFFKATMSFPVAAHRDLILLYLFTGLRREEGAQLKWSEIDFGAKMIRLGEERTKADRHFDIPMTDFVNDLMVARRGKVPGKCDWVFPSSRGKLGCIREPRYALDEISKACSSHITVHDLRRTFESVAASCRLSKYELSALLNHSLPNDDVTAQYVIPDEDWLRQPAQEVTDKLKELCGVKVQTGGNVQQLSV